MHARGGLKWHSTVADGFDAGGGNFENVDAL